jgi:hypothetical protein
MVMKFRDVCLSICICAPLAGLAGEAAACPIVRMVYAQADNPGVTAGFARQRVRTDYSSDLVLWIKGGRQTFWFGFSAPNGYGGTYISPQIDPRLVKPPSEDGALGDARLPSAPSGADNTEGPSIPFDAFRPGLAAFGSPPQSTDASPAYLFSRELGAAFHYNHIAQALGPQTETVGIDIAFWRPTFCARAGY